MSPELIVIISTNKQRKASAFIRLAVVLCFSEGIEVDVLTAFGKRSANKNAVARVIMDKKRPTCGEI